MPSRRTFVSGSMQAPDKLPLVKQALAMLVGELTESDRVAIVTYAGHAGLALPPTTGDRKEAILAAIESLQACGSTHGSAGITVAYEQAREHFIPGGSNRVILATDGDLNVGVTSTAALVELIRERAKAGVFLTVLGFGQGNLQDEKMEIMVGDLQLEGITENQSFGLDERDKTVDSILRSILLKATPDGRLVDVIRTKDGVESIVITTRSACRARGEAIPEVFKQP